MEDLERESIRRNKMTKLNKQIMDWGDYKDDETFGAAFIHQMIETIKLTARPLSACDDDATLSFDVALHSLNER